MFFLPRWRPPSPDPSVIIVSPSPSSSYPPPNLSRRLLQARQIPQRSNVRVDRPVPGRRVNLVPLEKPRPEIRESTSEKYLKQLEKDLFLDSQNSAKETSSRIEEPSVSRSPVEESTPDASEVGSEQQGNIRKSVKTNGHHEESEKEIVEVKNSVCFDVNISVELFLKTCESVLPGSEFLSVKKKMLK